MEIGKGKIEWTKSHKNAFDDIQKVVTKEIILNYPKFEESFEIHSDASDRQLSSVIDQDRKFLAFNSRKLNSVQRNY